MHNTELLALLNKTLSPQNFKDYCPNGLQVQGGSVCKKVLCAVSISEQLIDHATAYNYDAILVHHGLFWHKMPYNITGIQYNRISKLIKHNINLYAYHLPLDNHPTLGNNAQIANKLNIKVDGQTGEQDLLWYGHLDTPIPLSELLKHYQHLTQHDSYYFGQEQNLINKIAWCSGAAQNLFYQAIALNVDCYLTGEVNEQIMALAQESNVAYMVGGHYSSEEFGIKALCDFLQKSLNNDIIFDYLRVYNPI